MSASNSVQDQDLQIGKDKTHQLEVRERVKVPKRQDHESTCRDGNEVGVHRNEEAVSRHDSDQRDERGKEQSEEPPKWCFGICTLDDIELVVVLLADLLRFALATLPQLRHGILDLAVPKACHPGNG